MSETIAANYLDPQTLAAVGSLELRARMIVEGLMTGMIDDLNQREFDTVILRSQFYPMPVLTAIGQNYITTDLVEMNGFVYCIMRPRQE